MDKLAVYPGSFDPITNGHLDLLERGLKIFDRILIAVGAHPGKSPLFSLDERIRLIKDSLKGCSFEGRVEVDAFRGLLVDYVKKVGASAILRGLRALSDFEYEFQMSLMNRTLNETVETLFLMTGSNFSYVSSSIIKEVVVAGGCVSGLVPEPVEKKLAERFLKDAGASLNQPRMVVSRTKSKPACSNWHH